MTSLLCGQPIGALVGGPSPFEKVIVFGYDDGPSSGLALCGNGSEAYSFEQVATDVDGHIDYEAWDRGEELSVVTLAPFPVHQFDRLVARFSAIEPPTWPIWWPGVRGATAELNQIIEDESDPRRLNPRHPRLAMATAGLLTPIAAIRDLPMSDREPPTDWFALLGYPTGEALVATR